MVSIARCGGGMAMLSGVLEIRVLNGRCTIGNFNKINQIQLCYLGVSD